MYINLHNIQSQLYKSVESVTAHLGKYHITYLVALAGTCILVPTAYFSHNSPNENNPFKRIEKVGLDGCVEKVSS